MDYSDRLRARDWTVEPCTHAQALTFVEQYHYAKGMSNTAVYAHALYDWIGSIMGVCVCGFVQPNGLARLLILKTGSV